MIQPQTRLIVADNSGAKEIMCFNIPGGTRRRYARVGDIIVASVKVAQPNSAVKKGRDRPGGGRSDECGYEKAGRFDDPVRR